MTSTAVKMKQQHLKMTIKTDMKNLLKSDLSDLKPAETTPDVDPKPFKDRVNLDDYSLRDLQKQLKRKRAIMDDTGRQFIQALKAAKRFKTNFLLLESEYETLKKAVNEKATESLHKSKLTPELLMEIDDVCQQIQPSVSELDELLHVDAPPVCTYKHKCELCGKEYRDTFSFKKHLESHTGVVYTCDLCTHPPYTNEKAYTRHLNWHKKGEPKFDCTQCDKSFDFSYRLESHLNTHKGPTRECRATPGCTHVFTFEGERKDHEMFCGQESDKKLFECEVCFKCYKTPKLLKAHMPMHTVKKD